MLETVVDLKPDNSTSNLYSPGSINGKAYRPSALVVAWRVSAVAVRVKITPAPAITDPVASVTRPPISVELVCAESGIRQRAKQTTRAVRIRPALRQSSANKFEIGSGFILIDLSA